MTQESLMALRAAKCANIIKAISELADMSIIEATDLFYKSETAALIEEGVSDLQCRSDKYLATIVLEEYKEQHPQPE